MSQIRDRVSTLWKLYNRSRAEFENCLYFSLAKLNNLKRHGKDTNMDDNIKIPAAAFMTMVGGAGKIIVLKVDSEKPDH